jgi:predicted aspartyl protease
MSRREGAFRVPIEIAALTRDRFDRMEALVDTGASHTSWPRDRLQRLGMQPEETWPFELADGSEAIYETAWARVRIAGRTHPTIVVFGDPGSEPLLRASTLEGFHLAVDPVAQRLVPVRALLRELVTV